MTKKGKKFVNKYATGTEGQYSELVNEFKELSLKDQYEILCRTFSGEVPKSNIGFMRIFSKLKANGEDIGIGIADILNGKFENGTSLSEIKAEVPLRLYKGLFWIQKGDVVSQLNIFKNIAGEIDKNKVIEYLSDSTHSISLVGESSEIFKHLDPDEDRRGIFSIIAARIQADTNWGEGIERTDYMHTASVIDKMFSELPSRKTWHNRGLESKTKGQMLINAIRGNYVKGRGDSSKDWWRAMETIEWLYPRFKTIMVQKYGNDVAEDIIESDFSLCVLGAVEFISEKAKEQSIELVGKNIAGKNTAEEPKKDGDDRVNE